MDFSAKYEYARPAHAHRNRSCCLGTFCFLDDCFEVEKMLEIEVGCCLGHHQPQCTPRRGCCLSGQSKARKMEILTKEILAGDIEYSLCSTSRRGSIIN